MARGASDKKRRGSGRDRNYLFIFITIWQMLKFLHQEPSLLLPFGEEEIVATNGMSTAYLLLLLFQDSEMMITNSPGIGHPKLTPRWSQRLQLLKCVRSYGPVGGSVGRREATFLQEKVPRRWL